MLDMNNIWQVVLELAKAYWGVFARMSPWLLGGFFIAGVLATWLPRGLVMRWLGGQTGMAGVLRAVLVGVPLPICSCGVIPISTGLRRHGAGRGATAGFLISTPQTGVDSILATYALMGPVFAVCRPLAALLTGLAGGGVVEAMTRGMPDDAQAAGAEEGTGGKGLGEVLRQGYVRLLGAVVKPLAVGLAVSALVTVLVPDSFFAEFFRGREWLAMPVLALVGFPMYVCSTAAIPIAASLMGKGVSAGAAFVFLMVGPAVNALSMTTVAALIGRKATVAYAAVIVGGALLCGAGINLLPAAWLPAGTASCSACGGELPGWGAQASGVVLAVLMARAWWQTR